MQPRSRASDDTPEHQPLTVNNGKPMRPSICKGGVEPGDEQANDQAARFAQAKLCVKTKEFSAVKPNTSSIASRWAAPQEADNAPS